MADTRNFAGYEAAFTGYYVKRASVKVESKRGYAATRIEMETGYSFSQLLSDIRLQTAADLLCRTNKSVEEIMEEVGCGDSAAFYRNFKRRYGVTPQTYRIQRG